MLTIKYVEKLVLTLSFILLLMGTPPIVHASEANVRTPGTKVEVEIHMGDLTATTPPREQPPTVLTPPAGGSGRPNDTHLLPQTGATTGGMLILRLLILLIGFALSLLIREEKFD